MSLIPTSQPFQPNQRAAGRCAGASGGVQPCKRWRQRAGGPRPNSHTGGGRCPTGSSAGRRGRAWNPMQFHSKPRVLQRQTRGGRPVLVAVLPPSQPATRAPPPPPPPPRGTTPPPTRKTHTHGVIIMIYIPAGPSLSRHHRDSLGIYSLPHLIRPETRPKIMSRQRVSGNAAVTIMPPRCHFILHGFFFFVLYSLSLFTLSIFQLLFFSSVKTCCVLKPLNDNMT